MVPKDRSRPRGVLSTVALLLSLMSFTVTGCEDRASDGDSDADADVDFEEDGDVESDADADPDADADDAPAPPEGCNPLAAEWDCLLPYPSDFFLVADSDAPGGQRVVHTEPGLPLASGVPTDVRVLRSANGFSRASNILTLFPMGVDADNLVFHTDDMAASTADDSPTLIIHAATGERVPHFAELDPRATEEDRRALILHPVELLDQGERYIVVIRDLRDLEGQAIAAPAGFGLLRDGAAEGDRLVGELIDHYESEIFPVLDDAGVSRSELILAWDFTTNTFENRSVDLLRLRELAMAAFDVLPPSVRVPPESVETDVDENIALRIEALMEVPLYLESTEPGALLHRDEAGVVIANGTTEVEVLIQVPRSILEGEDAVLPGRIVQFGHGFFGTRHEADGFPRQFAQETASVLVAVDWWGMAEQDQMTLANDIFADFGGVLRITDRVHQAMVNQMALTYAIQTSMTELEELSVDGALVYDPEESYFYGISNGHILGSTFLAISPHFERVALGSGGCDYSDMMFRSMPFGGLLFLMEHTVDDALDIQKWAAMAQLTLDAIDPATYVELLVENPLPGAPESRRILMQGGVGDPYVPNIATHLHARELGLPLLSPAPREIWGLETAAAPFDGSAFVEFDFNEAAPLPGTYGTTPSEDNGVHQAVRASTPSIRQIDAFFRPDGEIENFCDGACDPE